MESVASCTSFISSRTQPLFRRFFTWLGKNIYLYHCWFMALGILLTFLCTGGGIAYFMLKCADLSCTENRSFYLWIPRDSTVWSQYQEIIEIFGTYPSLMSLLLRTSSKDSIIMPSNMDISYNIYNSINDITLNYENNNKLYTFNDLCLRSYPSAPVCDSVYGNFFGYFFQEDDLQWQNESNIETLINTPSAPLKYFLGGFEYDLDDNITITGAESLRLIYELEGSTNVTIQDIIYEYMASFQDYWSQHTIDYLTNSDIEIAYYTDRSFDDEISRVLTGDIPIFGLALITMSIYLMFTLGKISCIGARPWLAFSAIWVMLCALLMGFSISICIGQTFNTIVMLVPFILLGVGVDDMIILVDSYDKTAMPDDDILNAHYRLGNALASSGLSISLTSFCSSMAFFVGSATDIPGISSFCVYAAWSFLSNYILQFLLFVPLMVIDDMRIRKKKNFCCPCICIHDKKLVNQKQINFYDPEKIVKNNGAISSTKYKHDKDTSSINENKCKCNAESLLKIILLPILKKKIFRIIIIIIFIFTACASIYCIPFIKTDSDATKLVPDDSFVLSFIDQINEIYNGETVDELQIVIHNKDFSDINIRHKIHQLLNDMENQNDAVGKTDNWLYEFELWLQNKNKININEIDSPSEFYFQLQIFTNQSSLYNSEIIYDNILNPTVIKSTRFILRITKPAEPKHQYPQYILWNSIYDKYFNDDGYAFSPEYCFAFLSSSIVDLTIDSMIFAGIGVFCILILLLDFRMSIFILCIVVMIDINLFGWMYIMDISLDTLSYSQCVMAVGLTVDYVIHITHAITDAKLSKNEIIDANSDIIYNLKLTIALSEMGSSVIKGAFTTFLGSLALVISQSQAFRIFFYMFSGIIFIAVAHGCILTPALLGELKFIYIGIDNQNDFNNNQQKNKRISAIVQNLQFAHSAADSHASDFHGDDQYVNNQTKSPNGIGVNLNIGKDKLNANNRKSIDDKRPSIQMTNFSNNTKHNSDDSENVDDHHLDE